MKKPVLQRRHFHVKPAALAAPPRLLWGPSSSVRAAPVLQPHTLHAPALCSDSLFALQTVPSSLPLRSTKLTGSLPAGNLAQAPRCPWVTAQAPQLCTSRIEARTAARYTLGKCLSLLFCTCLFLCLDALPSLLTWRALSHSSTPSRNIPFSVKSSPASGLGSAWFCSPTSQDSAPAPEPTLWPGPRAGSLPTHERLP